MAERNLSTDFSTSPYFDDYDPDKKFLRMLFRPGLPVQTRELTQLQTILNDQISRLGSTIYDDGSTVTGGDLSVSEDTSIKLANTIGWTELKELIVKKSAGRNYAVNDELLISNGDDRVIVRLGLSGGFDFSLINNVTPSGFFGLISTENLNTNSAAEGASFEVNTKISLNIDPTDGREERPIFHVKGFTTRTSSEPPSLYGEYLTGTEFASGDELFIYYDETESYGSSLGAIPADFQSGSLIASVATGIFYTNGFYVLIDQQSTPLDKYKTVVSGRIGYRVREEIVTERDDSTLLDNSSGSANENAPGAHRFRLRLVLSFQRFRDENTINENLSDDGFYEIARIVDGEIVDQNPRPNNSTLGKELARRTYDVNGNFIIEPFKMTYDDKLLFTFNVTAQTGTNITVTVSVDSIQASDFIGQTFVFNDIPYKISNATETGENEFALTLTSVPGFVGDNSLLVGKTIQVFDSEYFQLNFTPGLAYVAGNEFRTLGSIKRDVEKTTTAKHIDQDDTEAVSVNFGNYIVADGGTLNATILESDYQFGNLFNIYATSDATGAAIGSARIKQLRKSDNDKVEVYFFNSTFTDRTVTLDANGTNKVLSVNPGTATDDMLGSVITILGTRYRVVGVNTTDDDLTLDIPLETTVASGTTLTLQYNTKNIRSVMLAGGAILAVSSTVIRDDDNDGYPETRVLGSDRTSLLFRLSGSEIDSVSDIQYRYYKTEVQPPTDGTIQLNVNDTLGEQLWPVPSDYFIQNTATWEIVSETDISVNQSTNTIEFGVTSATNYIIIYPTLRNSSADNHIPTTFVFGNTETFPILNSADTIDSANGHVKLPKTLFDDTEEFHSIGLTGVYNVRGIYEVSGTALGLDITNRFRVDYGQRDEIVDHTKIALRSGSNKPSSAEIIVIVDRIRTNSVTQNERIFYNADSYASLYYDYVPDATLADGRVYNLRNTIDFRPRVLELSSATNFSTWNERTDKQFSPYVFVPDAGSDSVFSCNVDSYMSRSDKVIISPDLNLKVVQGNPATEPETPVAEDRSLLLYDLYLSAFSTKTDNITSRVYDNNRYKMSDISKLEKRLEDVEKNIQLDRVEKAILSSEVSDRNNTNLFKTGILVDSFSDSQVADFVSPDYRASIDTKNKKLRPSFDQYSFSLDYQENESTAKHTDDDIILAEYDDNNPVGVVEQILATRTENVNPFAVMDWLGELKLVPEKDFWKDIVRKPDVVTDMSGSNAAWSAITENASRTEWGNWEKRWTGTSSWKTTRNGWFSRKQERTVTSQFARRGTKTTVSTELKRESLGDKVVDQSVIEYMRSVPNGIRFRGISLKPNTILYPFFDDVSIMDNVRPAVIFVASANDSQSRSLYDSARPLSTSCKVNGETVLLTHKSKNLNHLYFHLAPTSLGSSVYDIVNADVGTTTVEIGTATSNEIALESVIRQKVAANAFRLKTDPTGSVSGVFNVPAATFKTGSRNFKLIDSSTGSVGDSNTSADRDFEASGLRQVVQRNIVTTRQPVVRRQNVSQSFVTETEETRRRWKDPLAETFLIDYKEYPNGLYLHSLDLWFTSRDSSVPVTIQIRPTNNGYPDSTIIVPFSEVHLDPEEVNVTETPKVDNYTRFKFSTPVFLEPGEYSYVIMANSVNYEVYTALMGENILDVNTGLPGKKVMNKQPFAGVMFKSQNASTWNAYQEEDIMFRLNRVEFTPATYSATLRATFDVNQLQALSPYKTNNGRFKYTGGGTDFFMYNLFKINVPELKNFDDVTEPTYSYQAYAVSNESIWAVGDPTAAATAPKPVEVNETITTKNTLIMKEAQPDSFEVTLSFGTNSKVVSPLIDAQQMNVIFIENLIDNLNIVPELDITIKEPGIDYILGDEIILRDSIDDNELGRVKVSQIGGSGEIEELEVVSGKEPSLITGNVNVDYTLVSAGTSAGTGAELRIRSELDSEGGIAEAKYISKRVALKSGFESEDLKVILSAYRPKDTQIYVYYKVRAGEDSEPFDNKPWNFMYELTNSSDFSVDENDYLPLEYVTYRQRSDGSVDSSTKGGARYTVDGVTYEKFSNFAVKIVMTSTSKRRVPRIENLGGLALISAIEPVGDE